MANHETSVVVFEPAGAPAPEYMINRTERPSMTPGRAAVLAMMGRYQFPGSDYLLSLLEIHKLAYFLQLGGLQLNLEFQKETYGPYADKLRHVLNRIEGHFIIGFGDGRNKLDTPIRLLPDAQRIAEEFVKAHSDMQESFKRVSALIEGFETPYGMELLSSVHWVAANELKPDARNVDAVVAGIRKWNARKCKLLRPEHVQIAWDRLREQSWI